MFSSDFIQIANWKMLLAKMEKVSFILGQVTASHPRVTEASRCPSVGKKEKKAIEYFLLVISHQFLKCNTNCYTTYSYTKVVVERDKARKMLP